MLDRLRSGDVLVLDGATGTELAARGVDCETGIWSAFANIEAPDVLRAVHEDYLRAGADIITANNFCTGPSFLGENGEGQRWREYSQAGVDIAVAARDGISPGAYIAGGIYPHGVFGRELTSRAQMLAHGGADLILVEFLPSVSDCVSTAQACDEIDLPLFLGIGNLREDGRIGDGTSVRTLVSALKDYRIDGILAMCSLPPAVSRFLPALRDSFSGFIGAYPHDTVDSQYHPESLADYALIWKEMGAQVIGGCCGMTPTHIAALSSVIGRS